MKDKTVNIKCIDQSGSVSEYFKTLYEQENFADVTIAFDDQTNYSAHKVILSALSPVFNHLLIANPHPAPLIYISGVQTYYFL